MIVNLETADGALAQADVELAYTTEQIETGLMNRSRVPPGRGMLFLLGDERDWQFWMHGVLVPLDVIFIGLDMSVMGIVERAQPGDCQPITIGAPSVAVLEVAGGW